MTKVGINAAEYNIGLENVNFSPHIVNLQLNILIHVRTAINIVAIPNNAFATGLIPTVNIWCAQTMNPKNPMSARANTIELYPNNLFFENVEITSEIIPNAGKIKIYTSGCPNSQNICW